MEYRVKGLEDFTPEELERMEKADRIFQQMAKELDLDPESIDGLVGWAEFVLGDIDEAELWRRGLDALDESRKPTIH